MSLNKSITDYFLSSITELYTQALSASLTTVSMGDGLMGYFLGILLVWKGIEFAFVNREKGEIIFEFIKLIILWGIVKWIITQYPWMIESVLSGFELITNNITSAYTAGSSGGTFVDATERLMSKMEIITSALISMDGVDPLTIGTGFSYLAAYFEATVAYLILLVASVIFQAVSMLMLAIVKIYIVVGTLVGPVMIPFLLFGFLSWIADGWIRFMITAGFMGVVINIINLMVDKLAANYVNGVVSRIEGAINVTSSSMTSAQALIAANFINLAQILYLAAMYIVLALVLLQAPTITEMLLSGRGLGSGASSGAKAGTDNAGKTINKMGK